MTEYTNNNKFTPQAQTYEVKYVEQQEQQKPKLSPAARQKIVNRSGSNYVSENQKGYGPMPDDHGCPQEADFEVTMYATGDYVVLANSLIASGKLIDKDFSGIQKRIDDLKSKRIKVYEVTTDSNGNQNFTRTEKCAEYEGWFQAKLESTLNELKEANVYGPSLMYTITRP